MKIQTNNLSIVERIASPTPKFFKKIRSIGLLIGAVGAAILAAPVALPAFATTIAGYLVTVGLVASTISTTAVETKK